VELLLAPCHRVGEYIRLLSALRHNTPPDHADITHLDVAIKPLNKLHQLLDEVNTIDIYYPDTVLPIHIAWHDEATAKSTTQDGGVAETYLWAETSVNAFV